MNKKNELIFILAMYVALGASAIEIKSISEKQILGLRLGFTDARPVKISDLPNGKSWSCEIFGVRSRMQVEKKDRFYEFYVSPAAIQNRGAQVLKTYQITDKGLLAHKGPLADLVKVNGEGHLVGELAVSKNQLPKSTVYKELAAIGHPEKTVLAYSLCK